MPSEDPAAQLGPPDMHLAGFQLWVHRREFPELHDYDDGNWLEVTAHVGAAGASVWTTGPILMTVDIERWRRGCQQLYDQLAGTAELGSFEPNLHLTLQAVDRVGHLELQVTITPNHLTQEHVFKMELDQSHLPAVLAQCEQLLQAWPIRGTPAKGAV